MTAEDPKGKEKEVLKAIARRWTKTVVTPGWTAWPNILLERQQALGLEPLDVNILLHIARYWWEADELPFPSVSTLAAAIGVDRSTVQRRIARLEKGGLIKRETRKGGRGGNLSNRYHFDGLITAATPFAQEAINERNRRQKEDAERLRRKGKPKLASVG
jgi:DNA-binding MarR family transcriptional regulator